MEAPCQPIEASTNLLLNIPEFRASPSLRTFLKEKMIRLVYERNCMAELGRVSQSSKQGGKNFSKLEPLEIYTEYSPNLEYK
jgi:hypothetical protein